MKKLNIFTIICITVLMTNTSFAQRNIDEILKDFRAGSEAFAAKDYTSARTSLEKFIEEYPLEYETREAIYLAAESARYLQDWHAAIRYYHLTQTRYPYSKHRRTLTFRLGQCYYEIKNLRRALYQFDEYQKAGAGAPFYIHSHIYQAEIYETNREWEKSIEKYEFVLRFPKIETKISKLTRARLHRRLADLYAERGKQPRLAYTNYMSAFELGHPKTAQLRMSLRNITLQRFDINKGFTDKSITDIKTDGDDIWIATFNGGLYRYVRSSNTTEKIRIPSAQVRGIHVDFDQVFVNTFDGIYIYNKKNSSVSELRSESQVFNLAQNVIKDDRFLYFSTLSRGLIQYDLIKKNLNLLDSSSYVKSNTVFAMDADHRYLAIGTLNNGVVLVDKQSDKKTYLNRENGFLHENNVKALKIDGRFLWIAVHTKGVYQYDIENGKIKFMNWGIPFPTVIEKREKEIWIGTTGSGIRVFDREKETLTKISAIDGLRSNEIQQIEIEDDYIWIGYLDAGIDILYRPLSSIPFSAMH